MISLALFVVVSSLLVVSCLDKIDLTSSSDGPVRFVIQGRMIIGSPTRVQVKISRLFNFSADTRSPIKASGVRLYDEDGNYLEMQDASQGNYVLTIPEGNPDFPVRLDRGYYIQLTTFDNRTFRSDLEKGLAVPRINRLDYERVFLPAYDARGELVPTEHVQYRVSTPLITAENNPRAHLNWLIEWTFKVNDTPYQPEIEQKVCYIKENLGITSFNSLDPTILAEDYLEGHIVHETRILRKYSEGLYFFLIQESLTETAYEYYRQLGKNTDRAGNVFDEPPGAVVSNIRNIDDEKDAVYGFFYVTQHDTVRTYVDPVSLDSPPRYCPPPGGILTPSGNCADLICCDCLSVPNSTTTKPSFWEK